METEQNIKTKTIVNLDLFEILSSLIQMSKLKIEKQINNNTATTTQQLVQRKMKIKKHINSTYKRKKRKAYREKEDPGGEEEEEDLEERSFILESQTEASFSREANNQSMLLLATANKVAKGSNVVLFWLTFVTAINIAQLICDTSNTWSVLGADLQGKLE